MSPVIIRAYVCLPIASLTFLEHQNQSFLIYGQGPILSVHCLTTNTILTHLQVFDSQTIHGVKISRPSNGQNAGETLRLLIWGGREVAQAEMRLPFPTGTMDTVSLARVTISRNRVHDWTLDAEWESLSDGVPATGFAITAHNEVLRLTPKSASSLELEVVKIASGLRSMLYSAQVQPFSASSVLLCAGTVFGEIVLWSCTESRAPDRIPFWTVSPARIFRGHEGSAFGVCVAQKVVLEPGKGFQTLIASCSDDRTIRLRRCTSNREVDYLYGLGELESKPEILEECSNDAELASAWGHISRIWGVRILSSLQASQESPIYLISRGEDATCQLWRLSKKTLDRPNGSEEKYVTWQLQHVSSDHFHSGKHIWSFATCGSTPYPDVFTGGGDGAIISRPVYMDGDKPFKQIRVSFRDVPSDILRPKEALKEYAFVSENTLIATTTCGRLLRGDIIVSSEATSSKLNIQWRSVFDDPEAPSLIMLAVSHGANFAFLVSSKGLVWLYRLGSPIPQLLTKVEDPVVAALTCSPGPELAQCSLSYLLTVRRDLSFATLQGISGLQNDQDIVIIRKFTRLELPATFLPTSILVVAKGCLIFLGSRAGGLAIYLSAFDQQGSNCVPPSSCIRHIHGSDTVSQLSCLDESDLVEGGATNCHFLSIGRDGSHAIHKVSFNSEYTDVTGFITLHRSFPPIGPNLEGATLIRSASGKTELEVHGFKGTNFVVFNATSHRKVLEVDFGGAQRNWAYKSTPHPDIGGSNRLLVWTRSSACHLRRVDQPSHSVAKPGGHGREIKALAIYDHLFFSRERGLCWLLATGAEDTAIRIWLLSGASSESRAATESRCTEPLSCVYILTKHTAGIQHLEFCDNFLFSSSGCEELYVWKLAFDVPVVEIGVTLAATMPTHIPESDLRITSFQVTVAEKAGDYLISAVYSNSMVRIFSFVSTVKHATSPFQLIYESFYNTTCLLHITTLPHTPIFLTASTNGAIAAWPNPISDPTHPTNYITMKPPIEHFIHQNAILALQTIHLSSNTHLVITGGDDNALGLTLTLTDPKPSAPRFATLLLPAAHAAAITAVQTLQMWRETQGGRTKVIVVLATAGNDQRLKTWRVGVDLNLLSSLRGFGEGVGWGMEDKVRAIETVEVRLLSRRWICVADVGGMGLVLGSRDGAWAKGDEREMGEKKCMICSVMIVGIGMEMLRITPELLSG